MAALAAVTLALAPSTASAHGLAHAQQIANATWGNPCAGGQVEVRTERMAQLGWAYVRPAPTVGRWDEWCVMALRDGWWRWSWATLCTVTVHEYGHLAANGHSDNPRSVMYPSLGRPFPGCSGRVVKGRKGSAAKRAKASARDSLHRRHVRAHAQVRYHRAHRNWPMVRRRKAEARRLHKAVIRQRRCRPATPSGNRCVGRQMAAQRGWRGAQWGCLSTLGFKESGWRHWARNPSSGAWGIGQFLGRTKAAYAHLGATSRKARRQINAMLHYIADRYGNPCNALAFHRRNNYY